VNRVGRESDLDFFLRSLGCKGEQYQAGHGKNAHNIATQFEITHHLFSSFMV
jgi:hypothetical protein